MARHLGGSSRASLTRSGAPHRHARPGKGSRVESVPEGAVPGSAAGRTSATLQQAPLPLLDAVPLRASARPRPPAGWPIYEPSGRQARVPHGGGVRVHRRQDQGRLRPGGPSPAQISHARSSEFRPPPPPSTADRAGYAGMSNMYLRRKVGTGREEMAPALTPHGLERFPSRRSRHTPGGRERRAPARWTR